MSAGTRASAGRLSIATSASRSAQKLVTTWRPTSGASMLRIPELWWWSARNRSSKNPNRPELGAHAGALTVGQGGDFHVEPLKTSMVQMAFPSNLELPASNFQPHVLFSAVFCKISIHSKENHSANVHENYASSRAPDHRFAQKSHCRSVCDTYVPSNRPCCCSVRRFYRRARSTRIT